MLHTAADSTNLGVVGPLFPNKKFEYIPINNTYGLETQTYNDFQARNRKYGKTLADFLPTRVTNWSVHYDPDFTKYTYGQPVAAYPRSYVLENLVEGDIVFFICSLAPYDANVYQEKDSSLKRYQIGKKNKYVFGFFTIKAVARVEVFNIIAQQPLVLNILRYLLEEGESAFEESDQDLIGPLKTLLDLKYIVKEKDLYKNTEAGERIALEAIRIWNGQESEEAWSNILKEGMFRVDYLSGKVHEHVIKSSHHYRRLKRFDWDYFYLIAGDPTKSALLTRAVQLTDGYDRFTFVLNRVGQSILKRTSDNFRGFRWIDEASTKLLAREIEKVNKEHTNTLLHLIAS